MTKTNQIPTIGRVALLAVVEWLIKYPNRSRTVEISELGTNSQTKKLTFDQVAGPNGAEEIKDGNSKNRGEQ